MRKLPINCRENGEGSTVFGLWCGDLQLKDNKSISLGSDPVT